MTICPVIERVSRAIQGRIDAAKAAGNNKLAQRWMRELGSLTDGRSPEVLSEIAFDPAVFERLAIYAAQKVRRVIGAFVGTGHVDPLHDGAREERQARRPQPVVECHASDPRQISALRDGPQDTAGRR